MCFFSFLLCFYCTFLRLATQALTTCRRCSLRSAGRTVQPGRVVGRTAWLRCELSAVIHSSLSPVSPLCPGSPASLQVWWSPGVRRAGPVPPQAVRFRGLRPVVALSGAESRVDSRASRTARLLAVGSMPGFGRCCSGGSRCE